jgi:hypothetical protein
MVSAGYNHLLPALNSIQPYELQWCRNGQRENGTEFRTQNLKATGHGAPITFLETKAQPNVSASFTDAAP